MPTAIPTDTPTEAPALIATLSSPTHEPTPHLSAAQWIDIAAISAGVAMGGLLCGCILYAVCVYRYRHKRKQQEELHNAGILKVLEAVDYMVTHPDIEMGGDDARKDMVHNLVKVKLSEGVANYKQAKRSAPTPGCCVFMSAAKRNAMKDAAKTEEMLTACLKSVTDTMEMNEKSAAVCNNHTCNNNHTDNHTQTPPETERSSSGDNFLSPSSQVTLTPSIDPRYRVTQQLQQKFDSNNADTTQPTPKAISRESSYHENTRRSHRMSGSFGNNGVGTLEPISELPPHKQSSRRHVNSERLNHSVSYDAHPQDIQQASADRPRTQSQHRLSFKKGQPTTPSQTQTQTPHTQHKDSRSTTSSSTSSSSGSNNSNHHSNNNSSFNLLPPPAGEYLQDIEDCSPKSTNTLSNNPQTHTYGTGTPLMHASTSSNNTHNNTHNNNNAVNMQTNTYTNTHTSLHRAGASNRSTPSIPSLTPHPNTPVTDVEPATPSAPLRPPYGRIDCPSMDQHDQDQSQLHMQVNDGEI